MLFESSYLVPSYREWYKRTDQTASYDYLRVMLQVLQAERGGPRRWLLKSPQHLEQIPALMATFPDARVVRTHRDPVRVTASIMTLVAYGLRMNHGAIDPLEIGRVWSARAEDLRQPPQGAHLLRVAVLAAVEDRLGLAVAEAAVVVDHAAL